MESVQALVLSVAYWRLAITARLGLASTGHLIYQSLPYPRSLGKPSNCLLSGVEWCLIVGSFVFLYLNLFSAYRQKFV